MQVTDIIPLDSKRRGVFIDGQYSFPLYLSEISKYHISEGGEFTPEKLEVIRDIIHRRIRERVLYLLGDMPRTEKNIRTKLLQSHYTDECITPVIEELKKYKYIDDVSYAYEYANTLKYNGHKSKRVVEAKLYEKGVPREIIYQVMNDFDTDETQQLEHMIRKKGYEPNEVYMLDYKTQQKLYRYLSGRGFRSNDICRYFL